MKTYYLFRIAYWLARLIPSRLGYWLCSVMGGFVFYFTPHIRRAVIDNMCHVLPGSSAHERRNIARRVIRNTYKNYYDLVRIPHMKPADIERMITTLEGIEHLEAASAQGRGVIVIGGHLGNFSLVAQLTVLRGFNAAVVAEDVKPAKLYNFINRLRGHFGLKFIRAGSTQVRSIFKLLKRDNGVLLLAADRDVGDTGVPVLFFDAPADLPEGPVVLALRLNCPLVPAYTMRLPDNTSAVTVYPPVELERTGDYQQDIRANMRKLAEILEDMIRKAPDQWVVLQRVWARDYTESDQRPASNDLSESPVLLET